MNKTTRYFILSICTLVAFHTEAAISPVTAQCFNSDDCSCPSCTSTEHCSCGGGSDGETCVLNGVVNSKCYYDENGLSKPMK